MSENLRRRHAAIWAAIDEIAVRQGISVSSLCLQSGGDATGFNPSKRVNNGRPRWPSTETIARVLIFSRMTYAEFGALVDEKMTGLSGAQPR